MNSHTRKEKRGFFDLFSGRSMVLLIIIVSTIFSIIGFFFFRFDYGVEYLALKPSNFLEGKYVWTLLTHMFVHGGIFHLFVNMFVLFSIGGLCEKIIGRKRFLWFYLLSGIFAGLLSVLAAGFLGGGFLQKIVGTPDVYMVGASGAIFGILGMLGILRPKLTVWLYNIPMPMLIALFVWAIGDIIGIYAPSETANIAHLAGLGIGVVAGIYYSKQFKEIKPKKEDIFIDEGKVKEWEKSF